VERPFEIGGWCSVNRIYKCINHFTIVEGGRPPRQQEPCEAHARLLYFVSRTPLISQVSIFNQDHSPIPGFPRLKRNMELKHTWISPN